MGPLNNGTIHLGYNGVPWTYSNSNDDVYTFTANAVSRKLKPFAQECYQAASEINKAFDGKPIYVLYSGGIDSEAVLHSFVKAGVPVTAVLIKFENDYNGHELQYAYNYFEKMNFKNVKIIDFNIRDWLKSNECRSLAREVQTVELGYTHLFKVALDQLKDGVTITGHEEPLVWRVDEDDGTNKWMFHCHERHYSIHKFFMKFQQDGVPSFFQWSTEVLNSFMHNDHWVMLFNNMYSPLIWNTEQIKYGFLGKTMGLAARRKYTSFEKLVTEILEADQAWQETLPVKWSRTVNTEIFEWYRRHDVRTL